MHFAKLTKYASEQICKHLHLDAASAFRCRICILDAASVLCMPKHPFYASVLWMPDAAPPFSLQLFAFVQSDNPNNHI